MLTEFIYTIKILIRDRGNLIWAVAFPLVLSTLFYSMFNTLDELYVLKPIPVLVVADDNYHRAEGYPELIDGLSKPSELDGLSDTGGTSGLVDTSGAGESFESPARRDRTSDRTSDRDSNRASDRTSERDSNRASDRTSERAQANSNQALLAPTFVADEAAAREQLAGGEYYGFIIIDSAGVPKYYIDSRRAIILDDITNAQQGLVISIQDRYIQDYELISQAYRTDPERFQDQTWVASLTAQQSFVVHGSISANPPSDALRYYYAALAFSSMQMMCFGLTAVNLWKANASPLGARRSISGQSKLRSLLPTLSAAWSLAFACVLVGFLYIRFGFQVSFGGREPAALVVLAASTLVTTLLGGLVASLPLAGTAKTGLIPTISCGLSIFAGLYGPASQALGDFVAREYPMLSNLNTARQVSDAFAALYYYDSYDRLMEILTMMAATAAIFMVSIILVMRRQRYRSL